MAKQVTKKVLNKADFMQLKAKVEKLEIPELGEVYIKVMTASEREGLERQMQKEVENNGVRATIFIYSVCDENGVLEFDDSDLEAVKGFPLPIVSAVYEASNEINGINDVAKEHAAKNS